MGHSLCSFILRQIPRRSPTHNAVYFTTTRLGGYTYTAQVITTKGKTVFRSADHCSLDRVSNHGTP